MEDRKCAACESKKIKSNLQCTVEFYYCKKFPKPKYVGYKISGSRFGVKAPDWCPERREETQ